jgi:hypothetical protein
MTTGLYSRDMSDVEHESYLWIDIWVKVEMSNDKAIGRW